MGTKEKGGKEVICTQSNVLAQQRGRQGSLRCLPRGRPLITLDPPILVVPLGPLQASPSAGCLHPTPQALHPKPPSGLSQ